MAKRLSWRHDLRVYWHRLRMQIRGAMSLRGAFVLQIVGMILNNTALIIAWLFFFHHFGTVNGWRAEELVGMMGINMLVFGITMTLSVGVIDLPRHVDRGSLDGMLTKPQPVISQLASSNIDATTFGDILLGAALVIWYIFAGDTSLAQLGLFAISMIVAVITFWCFVILLPSILAFYVFDSERLSRYLGMLFLDVGAYPSGILTGVLRTFLLIGLPGLLYSAVPLEVLHRFGWKEAVVGVVVSVFWLVVTLWFFKRALRRYESSNLVGAR